MTVQELRCLLERVPRDLDVLVYHDYDNWGLAEAWYDKSQGCFAIQLAPASPAAGDLCSVCRSRHGREIQHSSD